MVVTVCSTMQMVASLSFAADNEGRNVEDRGVAGEAAGPRCVLAEKLSLI